MLFNSYVFMLAFLPLTLLCYFLLGRLPEKIQLNKVFLVLASFLFYGYNNPSYVPIIAGSIRRRSIMSTEASSAQIKYSRIGCMESLCSALSERKQSGISIVNQPATRMEHEISVLRPGPSTGVSHSKRNCGT